MLLKNAKLYSKDSEIYKKDTIKKGFFKSLFGKALLAYFDNLKWSSHVNDHIDKMRLKMVIYTKWSNKWLWVFSSISSVYLPLGLFT